MSAVCSRNGGRRVFAGGESDEEARDPKRIRLVPLWKLMARDDRPACPGGRAAVPLPVEIR